MRYRELTLPCDVALALLALLLFAPIALCLWDCWH